MFDYPIPPRRGGIYAQLGLGPEATAEEINEARQELSSHLKQQQKFVQRELDDVYRQLPELRETWTAFKAIEAGSDKYSELQVKLTKLEEQAVGICSNFKSLREQSEDFERQLHEANLLAIQNPDDRMEYDRSHPPFELLKLADCADDPLDDRKVMLAEIRRELSDFFEQSGEQVFHPSDLTRNDFSHDFTRDPSLDAKS